MSGIKELEKMEIKIQKDKLLHIGAVFILTLIADNAKKGIAFIVSSIFFLASAKELWDFYGNGTCDTGDLLADVAGLVLGLLWIKIAQKKSK